MTSRHLRSSNHCLFVCFTMLEPELFWQSRVLPRRSDIIWNSLPADLTDNFNNMLLSGFKRSLKTYFYKLSFATQAGHERCPRLRFVSINWHRVTSCMIDWLIDWKRQWKDVFSLLLIQADCSQREAEYCAQLLLWSTCVETIKIRRVCLLAYASALQASNGVRSTRLRCLVKSCQVL